MTYDGTDRVAHVLGGFSRDGRAGVALRLKMKFCPFLFSVTCRF